MSAAAELERVQDLWFPDADLILRAGNKLFRVYSHILGARSTVFYDMVAFPQPANPEGETIDNHSVVVLYDSAAEVEVFLRAVFDSSFFMPAPAATTFHTVIGVMRLAHKYDVQYLFGRALDHLSSMYPHDFSKFLAVNSGMAVEPIHLDFPDGIDTDMIALHAASEVGALWFLPTIYYGVCQYPSREFLDAAARGHGLGIHERVCLTSHVHLVRATALTHKFLASLPAESCTDNCEDVVSQAREILSGWNSYDGERNDLDTLGSWAFSLTDDGPCSQCESVGRKAFDDAQLAFWTRMPTLFGLPSWPELEEMRRAVMKRAV
ncbi:hypothetical protein DFH06DRAFT_1193551 [Mycena polygramma]|nr:hypothetical protein DFH06DRAFT_1193551 [Mycena polygramma]